MAATRKFLFDTDFDAPEVDKAAEEAERKRAEAERAFVTAVEDARAAARREGVEEGRRAGEAAALASLEAQATQALETAARELTALGESRAQAADAMMHAGLELASAIACKAMPELARRHGLAEIEAIVADCLAQLIGEPRAVIRVNDTLLDALQERVQTIARAAGFEGKLVLMTDPALEAGDCRIEWADGGVSRNLSRLLSEIEGAVARTLGSGSLPAVVESSHA